MKNTYLCLLAVTAIFSASCNRYYYKPNAVNAPLFTDKGQVHLNLAGSKGDANGAGNTNFLDVQAAYSPVKHLGIIANYSTYNFTPGNFDAPSGNVPAKAYLLEGGVGGYYPVGERKVKMVIDFYAGGGAGNIESDVNMKATRFFMQPGIGMTSPVFDAGFNLRMVNLSFHDMNDNGRGVGYLQEHNLITPTGRRIDEGSYTFLEPSFTIRVGYKVAKAQFQTVFTNPLSSTYWNRNDVRFTVGFYFALEGLLEILKEGAPETPSLPEPPARRSSR